MTTDKPNNSPSYRNVASAPFVYFDGVAQGSNHHGCKSSKHFHVIIPDDVAGITQQLAIKEDRSFSNMVVLTGIKITCLNAISTQLQTITARRS